MFAKVIKIPSGRAVVATMTRYALAVALSVLVSPLAVVAQEAPKIAKIGVLVPSTSAASAHLLEAFRQGLRELGCDCGGQTTDPHDPDYHGHEHRSARDRARGEPSAPRRKM
jgi:hypothetical protein